jgi:hypothetical protein
VTKRRLSLVPRRLRRVVDDVRASEVRTRLVFVPVSRTRYQSDVLDEYISTALDGHLDETEVVCDLFAQDVLISLRSSSLPASSYRRARWKPISSFGTSRMRCAP